MTCLHFSERSLPCFIPCYRSHQLLIICFCYESLSCCLFVAYDTHQVKCVHNAHKPFKRPSRHCSWHFVFSMTRFTKWLGEVGGWCGGHLKYQLHVVNRVWLFDLSLNWNRTSHLYCCTVRFVVYLSNTPTNAYIYIYICIYIYIYSLII